MNRGISLHIGINNLSSHYNGSEFDNLTRSIASAKGMKRIARSSFSDRVSSNYFPNFIFADGETYIHPTVNNICDYIEKASVLLQEGDIFLLTYSGHGSQINFPDTSVDEKGFDETWCLYDRQFFDDEILELFSHFAEGVRVLFISDSCHSGTIISKVLLKNYLDKLDKDFNFENLDRKLYIEFGNNFKAVSDKLNRGIGERELAVIEELGIKYDTLRNMLFSMPRVHSLSKTLADYVYKNHEDEYNKIMCSTRARLRARLPNYETDTKKLLKASVLQISACQDDETTIDGVFTESLINVWNKSNSVDYCDFYNKIDEMLTRQKVGWSLSGKDATLNHKFSQQVPFTVPAP